MNYATYSTLQRSWQKLANEEVQALPPEQRAAVQQELERRFEELLRANGDGGNFLDLIGLGKEGAQQSFDQVPYPSLVADFDEAVIPSQLHAASDLYFIYMHERMGVFKVAEVLKRLFRDGRMRIQRGPGARGLYLLDKWQPLRYTPRDRAIAYMRVFNYGRAPRPAGAIVNQNFHYQFVALMTALAQYFRDITIGEVIRGSSTIDQRPYGTLATIQRLGTDLRYAIDRSSYGNIVAMTHETGLYLKQLLDLFETPDIKKCFDANNKWDVLEQALNRFFGGARELSQRAKMADSGRRVLNWVASSSFNTTEDPAQFRTEAQTAGANAEAWIAAYRLTDEGKRFPGVAQNLRWAVGLPDREARMAPG